MPIVSTCPKCGLSGKVPDHYAGKSIRCKKCGTGFPIPLNVQLTVEEPRNPFDFNSPSYQSSGPTMTAPDQSPQIERQPLQGGNIFKRYANWAGTRSMIFQSLFLGWTMFLGLATFGMMLLTVGSPPRDEEIYYDERDMRRAKTSAMSFVGCCGCGVYALIGFPLGIGAIATLEGSRKR